MALCGFEQWLREALRVAGAHAEFGKLEAQKVQEMKDAGENRDGSDFDGIASDHSGYQAVSRRIVFDKCSVSGDRGLQGVQGKIRWGFERGVFAFVSGQFPQ